ncbi:MAG: hypothetical protein J6I30_10265, partial [Pseudomonas sp.]|nr:hypothetical protein [Pseudomonas sp.]
QNLLTEDFEEQGTDTFYKKHYGHSQPITDQQQFMQHTGLSTEQFHELLAHASYQPRLSGNVVQTADQIARDHTAGARFINGPYRTGQKKLGLSIDSSKKKPPAKHNSKAS